MWGHSWTFGLYETHSCKTLCRSASLENKNPPYIYEQYNVFIFFMPKSNQQVHTLGCIHHSIVEAFTRRYHLPRYILMILGKDIIEAANFYDYGEPHVLGKLVNWISKELQHCVEARAEDLYNHKPGATHAGTKIIWVKMIPCKSSSAHGFSDEEIKILAAKPEFNKALDGITEHRRFNHIMNIISLDQNHYDVYGRLTYQGKVQYWKELDYLVKKFDRKEITLSPQEALHVNKS